MNKQWVVVNNESGCKVAGPYKVYVSATRKADKLDLEYGSIHYSVREAFDGR